MIGNIYRILCKMPNDKEYKDYHLLPLAYFKATSYKGGVGDDLAVKCLVLETGLYHRIYVDTLEGEGELVGQQENNQEVEPQATSW